MLEYNIDLFDATTIARMSEHLQQLLQGIVADPEQRLQALPWLTKTERQQDIRGVESGTGSLSLEEQSTSAA